MALILPPPDGPKKRGRREKRMRAVRPTRSGRKQYLDALTRMTDILKAATGNLSDLIQGGAGRAQVAQALTQLAAQTQTQIDGLAPGTARSFVTEVDRQQKAATEKALGDALGVDFARIVDSARVREDLDLAMAQNTALIRSIPAQHWSDVSQAVLDNYRGTALPDGQSLTQRLRQVGGITERRAALIARDQTSKLTGSLNQARQQDNGIEEYIWRTAGDRRVVGDPSGLYPKGNRVHGDHFHRDGQRFKWGEPPSDGHPGQAINCFPGSAKLALPNGCHKLWRHEYSGDLAFAHTADGALLEATPNHPVMTRRGWIGVGDLQQGDYLIQATRQGGQVGDVSVDNAVPSLEECFNFGALLSHRLAPAAAFDFHGDRPDHDVDVVDAAPDLWSRIQTRFYQGREQLGFARATIDLAGAILGADCAGEMGLGKSIRVSDSSSGGREGAALVIAQLLQTNEVGLSLRARGHGTHLENAIDDVSAGLQALRDFQNAAAHPVSGFDAVLVKMGDAVICRSTATAISGDAPSAELLAQVVGMHPEALAYVFEGHALVYQPLRVVEKGRREFSGHVYNLQTEPGWYGINRGIVAHNCRCVAIPVFNPAALEAKYG